MPTDRADVVNVAIPPVSGKLEAEAIGTPPSNKVTVPIGMQGEFGATVTVKEMVCPYTDGFAFDITPVVVFALFICKLRPSVPEFKLESVAVTMKLKGPAVHGMPEIRPAEVSDMLAGGRFPLKLHVTVPTPPCWIS